VLPVDGPAEWEEICSLALEQQTLALQPELQHLASILDGKDVPMPPRVVCTQCQSIWWCRCKEIADRARRGGIPVGWEPRPGPYEGQPPPGMLEVQQIRFSTPIVESTEKQEASEIRIPQHLPKAATPTAKRTGVPAGQTDWQAVMALLEARTLRLERTKPVFEEEVLSDTKFSVWLPKGTHYLQHVKRVLMTIPHSEYFKVGITAFPNHRFYNAHYAYFRNYARQKNGVRFDKALFLYAQHHRDTVAMLETCMISFCLEHYSRRCVNKKVDFDNHIRDDQSSSNSEDEAAPGPFFFYITHGKPIV